MLVRGGTSVDVGLLWFSFVSAEATSVVRPVGFVVFRRPLYDQGVVAVLRYDDDKREAKKLVG